MKHIVRSTLIIAIFFGIDKILGLGRQVLIARQFGLTYEIDVFNAANNIPDLLSALISGGALGVALIPVLSEVLEKNGRREAWLLFSRILNLAFLFTGFISLLIAVLAQPLVAHVIAPGFPEVQQQLTVSLMRLDLIAILIFSISGLVMAGLQANQHFTLPAMAPALYNLGQIFGVLILAPQSGFTLAGITLPAYGLGIYGLVYGVIIGAAFHLLIQVPALVKYHFVWTGAVNPFHPLVIKVFKLLGPRILTMFFIQLFFITRDNLASRLGEGAVTALNYGWFIMQVPETLIGTAFAIVLLPTLSEQIARDDIKAFTYTLNSGLRALLAVTIPLATIVALGIRPLVWILGFDAAGTDMVVWASRFYLLGLSGHAMLELAARSFYARQDAMTPLWAAFLNALGYLIFAITFSKLWGQNGIALANSLSFTLEALLLLWLLQRKVPGILRLNHTLWRALLAALIAGGMVLTGLQVAPLESMTLIESSLTTLGLLGLSLLVILTIIRREIKVVFTL